MYCRECGKQLRDDSKFCYQCGTKVITELENQSDDTTSNITTNNEVTANIVQNTDVTSNVVQTNKVPQKSWYEEIGATTNEQIKSYADKQNLGNSILIMTISLIWLAVSAFMPIIEVALWGETCSFFDISDIIEILEEFDFGDGLLGTISFMCKVAFIIGIILVILYFVNLVKLYRDNEKICNLSKYATILMSVPTLVILIEKLIIDSEVNKMFEGASLLKFTLYGWITIIVTIINMIVSCNCKETHYRNDINREEKVCMLCKTRYMGSSCPTCGSSLIVK